MDRGFRFNDARELVPYLDRLGVSDVYLSPILAARAGSSHGYDVIDPTRLNPELGSEDDFRALARELQHHDMGLLLDIVPNHMAAGPENPWWRDVLENGTASPYASYFDIDWEGGPDGRLAGRVLLPILGRPLPEAIALRELEVVDDGGGPSLQYFDTRLPLSKDSKRWLRKAEPDNLTPDGLSELLGQQHYELADWRDAPDRINYRRFFDINALVGMRVEEPRVFDAAHDQILRLVREGSVTGLRIDHVDGLADPLAYLRRLREAPGGDGPYVVVEKILLGSERLPPAWPVAGTTGYDFLGAVSGLFVDRAGLAKLDAAYGRLTGVSDLHQAVRRLKADAIRDLFRGEIHALARELVAAVGSTDAGSVTEGEVEAALAALTAALPVYRTYLDGTTSTQRDRRRLRSAITDAGRGGGAPPKGLAFLQATLLSERPELRGLAMRWQQLTGAAMAKGFEDRALYVYNRLVSQNDVGASPATIEKPLDVEAFHRWNRARGRRCPLAMNATATHDTKRGEDVRARISVLSDMAAEWLRRTAKWRRLNRRHKTRLGRRLAPSPNEEHLIYQTLVGAWPLDERELPRFRERLKAYMTKASREAGVNTSWYRPSLEYEAATTAFLDACLDFVRSAEFLRDLQQLVARIEPLGAVNSLAQTLLKITSPGTPDFYQGNELWDLSLVDPDSRRPVDFESRQRLLSEIDVEDELTAIVASWRDGRIKLLVTARSLAFRKAHATLFQEGSYVPLGTSGTGPERTLAFARRFGGQWSVTVVPLHSSPVGKEPDDSLAKRPPSDGQIVIPRRGPERWLNLLTGESVAAVRDEGGWRLPLDEVIRTLPVALLTAYP